MRKEEVHFCWWWLGTVATLLLVPCTICVILGSIFIVAEYQTKLVKKRLSSNMQASMSLAPLLSVSSVHDTLAAATMNPSYRFLTSTTWPYAQHAWIASQELGVDYEMVTVNYKTSRKTFLSLMRWQTWFWFSCQGELDQNSLFSLIISLYIAEKRHALLPYSHEYVIIMLLFTAFCSFSYFPLLRAKQEGKARGSIPNISRGISGNRHILDLSCSRWRPIFIWQCI